MVLRPVPQPISRRRWGGYAMRSEGTVGVGGCCRRGRRPVGGISYLWNLEACDRLVFSPLPICCTPLRWTAEQSACITTFFSDIFFPFEFNYYLY